MQELGLEYKCKAGSVNWLNAMLYPAPLCFLNQEGECNILACTEKINLIFKVLELKMLHLITHSFKYNFASYLNTERQNSREMLEQKRV